MKKLIQTLFIISISIVLTSHPLTAFASSTPPDPPQQDHGGVGDLPPGGGAPIGNGTYFLISMALAYTALRYRRIHMSKTIVILVLFTFFISQTNAFATNLPPNPPSSGHGGSGDQPPGGGGAPLGDGVFILMLASAGYATKKYSSKNKSIELEE